MRGGLLDFLRRSAVLEVELRFRFIFGLLLVSADGDFNKDGVFSKSLGSINFTLGDLGMSTRGLGWASGEISSFLLPRDFASFPGVPNGSEESMGGDFA